jgi:hypothetical protein
LTKHGLLDASTDTAVVTAWWDTWPTANIGLRTGITFDVLDLDGPEAIGSLQEVAPGYKHTGPVSATGRGFHLLFEVTGAKNGAGMRPKLDFRGQNGYIVAPPSLHPSGHRYTWSRPSDLALPAAPYWLLDLVYPPAPEHKGTTSPIASALAGQLDLEQEFHAIGVPQFQQKGSRRVGLCPFHNETTPSLTLYANETFYCFGCNAWGDALNVRNFARSGQLR